MSEPRSEIFRGTAVVALFVLLLAGVLPASPEEPPDPDAPGLAPRDRVNALFERTRHEQSRLLTLTATFVQNSEGSLLLEPEEARGTFSFKAPGRIRWDFDTPDPTTIVTGEREMLVWHRGDKWAERRPLGRQANHMLELLGASPSLETLQRYFSVTAVFPKTEDAPYVLKLDPRFARVQRRIKSMTVKLDRELFVPVVLRYVDAQEGTTEIRFDDLVLNSELPDVFFDPELPDDVVVKPVS